MGKGQQSRCLNLKETEIVLEDIQRLSGCMMRRAAGREILAPSSSLSPKHEPIRLYNQKGLCNTDRRMVQSLGLH